MPQSRKWKVDSSAVKTGRGAPSQSSYIFLSNPCGCVWKPADHQHGCCNPCHHHHQSAEKDMRNTRQVHCSLLAWPVSRPPSSLSVLAPIVPHKPLVMEQPVIPLHIYICHITCHLHTKGTTDSQSRTERLRGHSDDAACKSRGNASRQTHE